MLQFTKKNVFQENLDTQKEFHCVCFLVFQVKTITQKFSSSGASIVTTLVNMYRIYWRIHKPNHELMKIADQQIHAMTKLATQIMILYRLRDSDKVLKKSEIRR